MSLWSRVANAFRPDVIDDIDAELQSHLDEAEDEGRDPAEASRAFGSRLRAREAVHDAIVSPWLESLMADAVFGWRQLSKHKIASAAAILSLALGIGSCMAAFRLIDALFLRPLPVASPEHLYVVTWDRLFDGQVATVDAFDYPSFLAMRAGATGQAELMAIKFPDRLDLTFGSDQDMERAWAQYVSGWTFGALGIKPACGRLLTESDDLTPRTQPHAVISYDYWTRRFGKDPDIVGRQFRVGSDILEVVGVAPQGFTGTDPGTFTDIFLPNMMDMSTLSATSNRIRTWVIPKPGVSLVEIRERIGGALRSYREDAVKSWPPGRRQQEKDTFVAARVSLEPASGGRSPTQREYRRPLIIFGCLVALVLLIACANVANLMTVQAAARAREMALRVSIGAGRARLIQLVLMESAMVGAAASTIGLAFSWWAAPFIVSRLNPPDQPVRLALAADWRVTTFALTVTFAVTLLFGLAPALRASSIRPASALKGGEDPRGMWQLTNGLVAGQVAFCLLVVFVAGLFVSSFDKMAGQPTGFSSERVLTLESASSAEVSTKAWYQATQQLRSLPGVESAAVAQYALMSNNAQTGFVWANDHAPDGSWTNSVWFLGVSPGWFDTMGLRLLKGRDFRWDDEYPNVAVVNETFARRYFGEENAVGRSFETISNGGFSGSPGRDARVSVRIVGVVRDARYEDMRLPIPASAYVPFRALSSRTGKEDRATFIVRSQSSNPMLLASMLRREIVASHRDIRVANVVTQEELVQSQMVRERMMAALSLFFAAIALLLAVVGLYGVLDYAVLERRRELGIRIALGATTADIVRRVTFGAVVMVVLGSTIGLACGLVAERYVAALLYEITFTDPRTLALPLLSLLCAAVLASLVPVLRAVRIDPALLLRSE